MLLGSGKGVVCRSGGGAHRKGHCDGNCPASLLPWTLKPLWKTGFTNFKKCILLIPIYYFYSFIHCSCSYPRNTQVALWTRSYIFNYYIICSKNKRKMVQQRLKDYKPFTCSKIFHTLTWNLKLVKKGWGGMLFVPLQKAWEDTVLVEPTRVNLCSLCQAAESCFSVYYAQVCGSCLKLTVDREGRRAARCSKPQPNGSCEAVYRIWAAKSLLRCERWD